LSAPWNQDELNDFVEDVLLPRIERLEGVAQAEVWGMLSRELRIELLPDRMAAHGVDVRELRQVLQSNHVNVSGGYLREGSRRLLVRTIGEFRTPDEIRDLPIRGDGLRVGDVADVRFGYPDKYEYSFLNGSEAISLSVNKASDANLLEVVGRVKAELQAIQQTPEGEGLEFRHFHDTSVDVRQGLTELGRSGLIGGGLAIVFMFLFLRKFRTTLLDNSIVVIESIFRHRQDLGASAKYAALGGASDVAMPIICSTMTTMCVFVPLIFFGSGGGGPGSFSRFMGDIGTTVCVVMLGSLVISLTVVPMIAAILLRSESKRRFKLLDRISDLYGATLAFTLRHRFIFTMVIGALLYGSWELYNSIERSFNQPSQGRALTIFVETPRQMGMDDRLALYDEVYGLLDSKRDEWEIADIAHQVRRGGGRSRGYGGGNRFEVYLKPEEVSEMSTDEVTELIREAMPQKVGVLFKLARTEFGPPGSGRSGMDVELIGDDMGTLELLVPRITDRLRQIPIVGDIDNSFESGDDEIRVSVNRERALQGGLSSQAVAMTVNGALSSRSLAYFKTAEREIGMVMQYREEDRETLDQLKKMPVLVSDPNGQDPDGASGAVTLPISSLASFRVQSGPSEVERENRRSKVEIDITAAGGTPGFMLRRPVQMALADVPLPPGYEWSLGRRFMEAEEDASRAVLAMILAVVLIYMIMAALFEDFLQPFTIMLSIPFAFIGVGLIMYLAGQPRSDSSNMGLLILAGIVVNNAIVLIDHINRLRREGIARDKAIVLGGKNRLRPILMTAVTTILGLSPMVAPFFLPQVFGQPEGRAAFWAPVGLVILGGLTTSTFLTLLVIPTVYSLVDDVKLFVQRVVRAVTTVPRRKMA
ncbi:MAG: efflux RND transporter permease subunit, partial [Acidobacteriota bacterium]|nr:efflux RND transporter permease subunit [Acidobacteriota bacterium]